MRKRQFPLVGGGTGHTSWVHLDDAASATVLAVEQKARGVFNIVDDEPAPASEWLPYRILGSVSEAEDAVQKTWLRCEACGARRQSPLFAPVGPEVGPGIDGQVDAVAHRAELR